MTRLYTIGYEGFTKPVWTATLMDQGIEVVVDVRAAPHSRKPGFSKVELTHSLDAAGVEYIHLGALGNPRALRDALGEGRLEYAAFVEQFSEVLDDHEPVLREILERSSRQTFCLLCYEEDPARCHRSLVAERLRQMEPDLIEVVHLRR